MKHTHPHSVMCHDPVCVNDRLSWIFKYRHKWTHNTRIYKQSRNINRDIFPLQCVTTQFLRLHSMPKFMFTKTLLLLHCISTQFHGRQKHNESIAVCVDSFSIAVSFKVWTICLKLFHGLTRNESNSPHRLAQGSGLSVILLLQITGVY